MRGEVGSDAGIVSMREKAQRWFNQFAGLTGCVVGRLVLYVLGGRQGRHPDSQNPAQQFRLDRP